MNGQTETNEEPRISVSSSWTLSVISFSAVLLVSFSLVEHWIDEIPLWAQLFFPGVALAILWKFAGSDGLRRFWGAIILRKGRRILIWFVCVLSIVGLLALSLALVESLKSKTMEAVDEPADSGSVEPSWTLIEKNGVEYVSDRNVSEFYSFGAMHEKGILRIFKHENLIMTWTVGMPVVSINGIDIDLKHSIAEIDGRALLSAEDLANVVHPIINPSSLGGTDDTRVVVIDPRTDVVQLNDERRGDTSFRLAEKFERELLQLGFRVILTRRTDTSISNKDSFAFASRESRSIYIALLSSTKNGIAQDVVETTALVCPERPLPPELIELKRGQVRDRRSLALAVALQGHAITDLKSAGARVSRVDVELIKDSTPPSVLIESTSSEWTDEKLEILAKALADAVVRFVSI